MAYLRQHMQHQNPRDMYDMVSLDISGADIYKCENIENMPIAMAYVPWQHWKGVYDLDKAYYLFIYFGRWIIIL